MVGKPSSVFITSKYITLKLIYWSAFGTTKFYQPCFPVLIMFASYSMSHTHWYTQKNLFDTSIHIQS